jgi:tRNA(Ile)-lysidine synthetase-like protein
MASASLHDLKVDVDKTLSRYVSQLEDALEFWFPNTFYQDHWFSNSADDEIRVRFSNLLVLLEEMETDDIIKWVERDILTESVESLESIGSMSSDPSSVTTEIKIDPYHLLAIVICLDQFSRNVYRNSEKSIYHNDPKCIRIVTYFQDKYGIVHFFPINRRIFYLLPYRHQKTTPYLDLVTHFIKLMETEIDRYDMAHESGDVDHTIPSKKQIKGYYAIVTRFKNATLRDYSKVKDTIRHVKMDWKWDGVPIMEAGSTNHLILSGVVQMADVLAILDTVCLEFDSISDEDTVLPYYDPKVKKSRIYKIMSKFYQSRRIRSVTVSLSGGVDSMVISYVLHHLRIDGVLDCVSAVHVDYGNRDISLREAQFVEAWSRYLRIPLITRRIEHMRRSNDDTVVDVDRSVYESATKELRFNLYRHAMEVYDSESIVLGHHGDDLAENVLMNTIRGGDLLDLYTMVDHQVISGIPIDRPLLPIGKDAIYEFSELFEIPYLADTTSESCMRGTVRKTVLPALEAVDAGIKSSLMDIGRQSSEWRAVIDSMVIKPIISQFVIKKYGIYLPWNDAYADLPLIVWNTVLCTVFHEKIGVRMISRKNLSTQLWPWFKKQNGMIRLSNGYIAFFHNQKMVLIKYGIASLIQKLPVSDGECAPNSYVPVNIPFNDEELISINFNGWKITYWMCRINRTDRTDRTDRTAANTIKVDNLLDGGFRMLYRPIYAAPNAKAYRKMGIDSPDGVHACLTYGMALTSKTKKKSSNKTFFSGLGLNRYIPKIHFFTTDEKYVDRVIVIRYSYE